MLQALCNGGKAKMLHQPSYAISFVSHVGVVKAANWQGRTNKQSWGRRVWAQGMRSCAEQLLNKRAQAIVAVMFCLLEV
jgi:hypothetical protein